MVFASELIKCLCDTDEEISVKFVKSNDSNDSLVKFMNDFCDGYKHVCGYAVPNGEYFFVDVSLNGVVPDILFEHKDTINGKPFVSKLYGYLMD